MATKQLNIRPSGIGRTIACPASVRLSAKVPYQESGEAAKIGTAIHALAEQCFKDQSDPMLLVGTVVEGITMTEENCDFAKQYLDAIFNIYNEVE
jgi:hypothetical protein